MEPVPIFDITQFTIVDGTILVVNVSSLDFPVGTVQFDVRGKTMMVRFYYDGLVYQGDTNLQGDAWQYDGWRYKSGDKTYTMIIRNF